MSRSPYEPRGYPSLGRSDHHSTGKSDHSQQRVNQALFQLHRAISIPGSHPDYHYKVMERHRREWPTLWAAIDNLLRL